MPKITVSVQINGGSGDATVNIFNNNISYQHYFPNTGNWGQPLDKDDYLVGMAGTCPPGGNVVINITGITSSSTPLPLPKITTPGPFLQGLSITV